MTYIHEHLNIQQPEDEPPAAGPGFSALPVAMLAALVFVAHLAVNAASPYGLHRDEFLYLAMGRHLQLWRMDFPPAMAVLANISRMLGDSVVAVRLFPALAGGLLVVLAARLARAFGGGRWAQILAALCMATSPLFLRPGNLFHPVVFDQLWWSVGFLALAALATAPRPAGWILLGVACGLGLLTKFSILFFGAAVFAALLLTPMRRALATPWPWAAAAVALCIGAPSLAGQVALGWPLRLQMAGLAAQQLDRVSPAAFLGGQLLFGPAALLGLAGLVGLLAGPLRAHRVSAWTVLGVLAILLVFHGKAYYFGPVYPALCAAGAALIDGVRRERVRRALRGVTATLLVAYGAVTLPMGLPFLPPEAMARYAERLGIAQAVETNQGVSLELPQDYADMLGWQEQVAAVAQVYYSLTPDEQNDAVLFADNYGEAGALEFYGPGIGLPGVVSVAGTYWQFGPGRKPGRVLLTVGVDPEDLREAYDSVEVVTRLHPPWVVPEERDVALCIGRGPRRTLQAVWPTIGPRYH